MKRLFDIVAAALGLMLFWPIMAAIAVMILVGMGRPVLLRQTRPGLLGRPFTIVKFRTMRNAVDESGLQKPDAERLTKLGKGLRATSLDELPELWNVLKGDMSLVGPRPLLCEYLSLYTPEQARRHAVRPGITGWAQVNGRNASDWNERLAQDVWYVDHRSMRLDLKILWLTFWKVLSGAGVSHRGHATMPKFTGTKNK